MNVDQAQFYALLNLIPTGVVVIDAQTHRILAANNAALEMLGRAEDEIVGAVCHQYICPAEEGKCPITDLGQTVDHSERVLLDADGQPVPIIKTVSAIKWDGRDCLLESFTDITDLKRAEESLRRSEARYRTILDNIEDGYFELDLAGRLLYFNDPVVEITGYSREELQGMDNRQYMSPETAKMVFKAFNRVYRTGEPIPGLAWELIRKDGTTRSVETSVTLMRDRHGNPIGFRGILRDVTFRQRYEEDQQRLLKALERKSTQLQTAAEVSRAIGDILDADALLPTVVELVRERFDLYYVGLFLVDQTGRWTGEPDRWAVLRAGTGEAGRNMLAQGYKLALDETSTVGRCILHRRPYLGSRSDENIGDPLLPDSRVEMVLPLVSRGQVIGAMTIHGRDPAALSEDDIPVFQTMADQLANAVENARLFEAAQHRAQRLAVVNRLVTVTGSSLLLDEILEMVYRELVPVFQPDAFFIAFYDEETDGLDLRFIVDDGERLDPMWMPVTGFTSLVVREKKPLLVRDAKQELARLPEPVVVGQSREAESWLGVPMLVGDRLLGVINTQAYRPHAWDEEDQLLLTTIADQVAVAVERARLYEQAQKEIAERRQAEEALRQAHEEMKQYTERLERRTAHLQAAAEVAREAAAILDVQRLLDTTVNLISERFGFYHAGIFLIDEAKEYAILRAASSEGGHRMLEHGHRLQVGKVGIVGYVAATGEPRIALDVGQDAVHFDNPYLPDTHSEMGLPLKARGEIIGVLDVQDTRPAAFTEEDVAVLQTMADQLAVAIANARLAERTEEQLRELRVLYGERTASLWDEVATTRRGIGYVYDRIDVAPVERIPVPVVDDALTRGETVALTIPEERERVLAAPLRLHDQIIGALGIQETDGDREWAEDEIALVEAVSEQVAQALENAQLFAETQRSARQMQVLNELAQALATHLDVEGILEETYRGVSRLMDASNFYIGLYDPEREQVRFPLNITDKQADKEIASMPADRGLTGYIIQHRTPLLLVENVAEQLAELGIELVGHPAGSYLGVPLLVGERVLGVMAVQNYERERAYTERDRDLLLAVAGQTSIALQNAYLFEEIQRKAERERQIYEITAQMRRVPDMATILRTAVEELGRALQVDRAVARLMIKPREEQAGGD